MPGKIPNRAVKKLRRASPTHVHKQIEWVDTVPTVICGQYKYSGPVDHTRPIAMLDLDGTIIRPKNGRKRPTYNDPKDWEWAFPNVPDKIHKLAKRYRIVIISNQKRLDPAWKQKVSNISRDLDIPLVIYAATADDGYRKPRTQIATNLIGLTKGSFFCGDAAGRAGDFADTDRKFAINLGIKFQTPEGLFLGSDPKPYTLKYPDMQNVIRYNSCYLRTMLSGWGDGNRPTLHMTVGLPGSGKSWFAHHFFESHDNCVRINTDTIGTIPKSIKAAQGVMSVEAGKQKHIVVDNTSLDPITRAKWISVAKKYGYLVICYNMQTEFDICRHNIAYRAIHGGRNIQEHVLRILQTKYKEPSKEEGFTKVFQVPFSPVGIPLNKLGDYCKYLY